MKKSKKDVQKELRGRWKSIVSGSLISFLLGVWLLAKGFGIPIEMSVLLTFILTMGSLQAYYILTYSRDGARWIETTPYWFTSRRIQRLYIRMIVPLGTASGLTVGMLYLLEYVSQLGLISKENRILVIAILVVTFIIGTYLGNLLLKKTKLRWWVESI